VIHGIDHTVIAVPDPDRAAATLEDKLGLRASEGGRHEHLGTFNRLIWLGDCYLELVGVFDPALAADSWLGRPVLARLKDGGGLATWAVGTDDLSGQLRWAAVGALTGPIDGERRRTDGQLVRWRLAYPQVLSATSPFFIEHDRTAVEWTPEESRARAMETHPIGGRVRLASLEIAAESTPAAAAGLRSLLATTAEPDGRRAVRVGVGQHFVRLAPRVLEGATAVIELATDTPVRRRSARIGTCEVRLTGLRRQVGSNEQPALTPTKAV
jgi:catechol 2,3-dioxygenase-like lactoylglutathione lyase family enzyme